MPKPKTKSEKVPTRQVNVRWTRDVIEAIDAIALVENNDRSEVVRFLVEWALPLRNIFGSFEVMRSLPRESYTCFIETVEELHIKKEVNQKIERERRIQEFLKGHTSNSNNNSPVNV